MNNSSFKEIINALSNHSKLEEKLLSEGEISCSKKIDYTLGEIEIPKYVVNVKGDIYWKVDECPGDRFTPPSYENVGVEIHISFIQVIDDELDLPLAMTLHQDRELAEAIKNLITY